MSKGDIYTRPSQLCEICGKRCGGAGGDHTECAKIIQEMHSGDDRPEPAKKLSKKKADKMYYYAKDNYE